ncbi:MAG TPA: hypothetical protein VKY31_04075 [Terriglobia bacterium]|nr:hypothetical protein [Terriglobia bacterium]
MWLTHDSDAYPLIAELGELPETSSYDFLVILPDRSLAALDEQGYKRIKFDLSNFNLLLRTSFGPFSFDPLNETKEAARKRIKKELDRELASFLSFAVKTLPDWQGYLEPTRHKRPEHFDWAAAQIVGGQTIAEVSERLGLAIATVGSGIDEVKRHIGLDLRVGRRRGIREKRPRRRRDS